MDQTIKALWVAALRDPEAVQGHGVLGDTSGARCCLGVLCDIAVAQGVIAAPLSTEHGLAYDGAVDVTPYSVERWASLGNSNPMVPFSDEIAGMRSLAELNDGKLEYRATDGGEPSGPWIREPLTFAEIADLIDAHL